MNTSNKILPEINIDQKESVKIKVPSFYISTRFLLTLVLFVGYIVHYMQRTNMSIAVVCMVNSTAIIELEMFDNNSMAVKEQNHHHCAVDPEMQRKSDGKFIWSKADQGLILSAYFYGYIITQIPGGWLSMKFGAKIVILLSMLFSSIGTFLTPPLANLNSPAILIALRFLIGFVHGFMFSAIASMFSKWAPPKEKSRMIGFSQAGVGLGSVTSTMLGGYLCENGFYEGWGSIFILFGGFGIVWLFMMVILTSDSPYNHKFISQAEKSYILNNIPAQTTGKRRLKTPWKAIFTSKACLSLFLTNICSNWGGYLFLTQTPTYMKDILKFDIKANGIFSSFPYIACYLVTLISSLVADKLIQNNILSIKNCRILFNSIGMLVPMVISILLIFVDCSKPFLGVLLVTIGVGVVGCVVGSGFVVNINDIGGRHYSGVLYGISNMFGTVPGIVAPYFVGLMTPMGTPEEWTIVFIVTSVIYLIGAVPYMFFAKGEVEKWAILEDDDEMRMRYNDHDHEALNNVKA